MLLTVVLLLILAIGITIHSYHSFNKALSVLHIDLIEFFKRFYGNGPRINCEISTWEFVTQCIRTQERLLIYRIKTHIRSVLMDAPEEKKQQVEQAFQELLDREDCLMRLTPTGNIEFFVIHAQDRKSADIFLIPPDGLSAELAQHAKEIWKAKLILASACGQGEYFSLISRAPK